MESDDILYVCITCKKNGEAVEPRPGKILYDNLRRLNSKMNIKPVKCLAGCSNGCTLSLTNKNKWTYVIGNLTPDQDEADILSGFTLYKKTLLATWGLIFCVLVICTSILYLVNTS